MLNYQETKMEAFKKLCCFSNSFDKINLSENGLFLKKAIQLLERFEEDEVFVSRSVAVLPTS